MPDLSPTRARKITAAALLSLAGAGLAHRFGDRWLRAALLYLSGAGWARTVVSEWPVARQVALRFTAGESRAEALAATRVLNDRGFLVTLDYLGESVTETAVARDACQEIGGLLAAIDAAGLNANVSVKLSQLGLKVDADLAFEHIHALVRIAADLGNRVRIDMEESETVATTLAFYERLRFEHGFDNVGVVIQSYLYRSADDVARLVDQGAWVRLCKGAYMEPPDVAFPLKADTDANFVRLMRALLGDEGRARGVYAAIATHDEKMIQATIDFVHAEGIDPGAFEFQMLYGVRRELQQRLLDQGYQVRIYVPYGVAWYPYFVRRLAERPANLWFFLSNLARA